MLLQLRYRLAPPLSPKSLDTLPYWPLRYSRKSFGPEFLRRPPHCGVGWVRWGGRRLYIIQIHPFGVYCGVRTTLPHPTHLHPPLYRLQNFQRSYQTWALPARLMLSNISMCRLRRRGCGRWRLTMDGILRGPSGRLLLPPTPAAARPHKPKCDGQGAFLRLRRDMHGQGLVQNLVPTAQQVEDAALPQDDGLG